MKAVMMQQGLWAVLKGGKADEDEKADIKNQDLQDKAYSTLILSLNDRVLREVSKEETAAVVWNKLESLYMTKSLANRLLLKQKLFTFRFMESRSIGEQLEEFAKCVDDLENIDEAIKDEDKALMLLNSLPKSFEQFKDAILLGRDSKVTYEEVHSALKMKEFQKAASKTIDPAAEGLNVKEELKKSGKKKFQKKQKPWKEKSGEEKETRSCHYCKKPGHLKKNRYALKKKQHEQLTASNTADVVEEVQLAEALNIADEISEMCGSWIVDAVST